MRTIILACFALSVLVGCAAPKAILANKAGITFENATAGNRSEVAAMAQRHCQKYELDARRIPDNKSDGVVTYSCS